MPIGAIRQSTTRRGRRNSPLALLSQVPRPFRPVYLRIESPLPQTATLRRNGARSLPLVVSLPSSRTYLACRTRSLFRERRRATRSRHDASLSSKGAASRDPANTPPYIQRRACCQPTRGLDFVPQSVVVFAPQTLTREGSDERDDRHRPVRVV